MSDTATAPQRALRQQVTEAMIWVAGSSLIGRLASFGSQFVLGWLLAPEDFALYAIAISVSSLLWAIKNGGLREILVQRGQEYDALAPGAARIALGFNLVLCVILAAWAPILARLYSAPSLPPLIWIVALYIIANTPATILYAKLSTDMRFKALCLIGSASMTMRHLCAIGLAVLGFGAASFVLPLLFVAIFDSLAYLRAVRSWPRGGLPTREVFRQTVGAARWVMLGTLAATLLEQGDYLTLGLLQDKHTVGVYFFGFQLNVALELLFISGLQSVMLPAFTRLNDQRERQKAGFIRACGMLCFVSAPLSFCMAIAAEPVVSLLWQGKWDAATPVFQLMLCGLSARLLVPLSIALVESSGNWRLRSLLMAIDGLGLVLATAMGTAFGGLLAVAWWVAGYRILSGLAQCLFISRSAGIAPGQSLGSILPSVLLALGGSLASVALVRTLLPSAGALAQSALSLALFTVLYALASLTLLKPRLNDLLELGRSLRRKTAMESEAGD